MKREGRYGEVEERVTISEAVARGREVCLLKYLSGGAMVVYGVPVSLQ